MFDNNEGGCTDVRFLDVNIGVVSGSVFDGTGAIARTTDGGMNWSTLFFDQPIEGVDFPVTNTTNFGFAVGAGGRILHTTNMGIAWTDQTSGTSANLNDVSFANDALRGIAVGDSGTILWTANGGGPAPTPTPIRVHTRPRDSTSYSSRTAAPDSSPSARFAALVVSGDL